jgi:hypothetical protein
MKSNQTPITAFMKKGTSDATLAQPPSQQPSSISEIEATTSTHLSNPLD